MLTCAMRTDPTWPPYVAETRRMVGYKATLPVFTCVPALYTSSSRSFMTAAHVGGKNHLLDRFNISDIYTVCAVQCDIGFCCSNCIIGFLDGRNMLNQVLKVT